MRRQPAGDQQGDAECRTGKQGEQGRIAFHPQSCATRAQRDQFRWIGCRLSLRPGGLRAVALNWKPSFVAPAQAGRAIQVGRRPGIDREERAIVTVGPGPFTIRAHRLRFGSPGASNAPSRITPAEPRPGSIGASRPPPPCSRHFAPAWPDHLTVLGATTPGLDTSIGRDSEHSRPVPALGPSSAEWSARPV